MSNEPPRNRHRPRAFSQLGSLRAASVSNASPPLRLSALLLKKELNGRPTGHRRIAEHFDRVLEFVSSVGHPGRSETSPLSPEKGL